MQDLELWTLDELCDHAFSIFEELASENLSAEDYNLYQSQYEQRAYVDLVPPSADWVELIQAELEPELHFEALNLTDEVYYTYVNKRNYNAQYERYGATYKLGITFMQF